MPRNNQRRATTGTSTAKKAQPKVAPPTSVLDFVSPTEIVDLPSEGRYYPENHPLHGESTIEIRYMTAKDEDILTSQSLLRKGVAMEKFLQNIIVDKSIKSTDLLSGDRSAILVAARCTGYGEIYETEIDCPACGNKEVFGFNLREGKTYSGDDWDDLEIRETGTSTFLVTLPITKVTAEIKLLTGADEAMITTAVNNNKKRSMLEGSLTAQVAKFIVSLNSDENRDTIYKFVEMMPAYDSYHLRKAYRAVNPAFDLTQEYNCSSCGHSQDMEVPITANFFWPNR